jgi:PAS domain S-box-containing protein
MPIINDVIPAGSRPPALWGWLVLPPPADPGDPAITIGQRIVQQAVRAALLRDLGEAVLGLSPHPINFHAGQERRHSNAAQEQFIGFSEAEIAADPSVWRRMSHPDDQMEQDAQVARLWRGEADRFDLDKRYVLGDGRTVWGRNSYVLVRDHAGRVRYQISYLFDMTRIKQAEQAAQEALAEARHALAVRASFLANASHEMRTPLHGIISSIDLLVDSADPAEREQLLDTMRLSTGLLLRLVNDVLELARVESDTFQLRVEPCDLSALLDELAGMLRPLVASSAVELSVRCSPEVPRRLMVDRDRIGQILTNLVGNAAKFTTAGRISVAVDRIDGTVALHRIAIAVSDTGTGMTPHQVDGLFAPFGATAEPIAGEQRRGSGLGLAIVRSLVERMGGEISVESILGAGTTIRVMLPMTAADDEASLG